MKIQGIILCDIDGTLMTDEGVIPSEIHEVLEALLSRGVKFVVASGRQINNLYALFGSHADDIYYIAQNGAVLAHGRKILYEKRMDAKAVDECVVYARQYDVYTMLYTNETVMVEDNAPEFLSLLEQHQVEYKVSTDLCEYVDLAYKLSYFKLDGRIRDLREKFSVSGVNTFLVNDYMIDITDKDTDKGKMVRRLKRLLGVRKADIMAFGDSENDLAMFAEAGRSFAVDNAPKEVQEKASCVIPSNNDKGVIVILKELFDLN